MRNKADDKWIEALSQRVESAEWDSPETGWDAVRARMESAEAAPAGRKVHRRFIIGAAAACLAAIAAGGLFLLRPSEDEIVGLAANREIAAAEDTDAPAMIPAEESAAAVTTAIAASGPYVGPKDATRCSATPETTTGYADAPNAAPVSAVSPDAASAPQSESAAGTNAAPDADSTDNKPYAEADAADTDSHAPSASAAAGNRLFADNIVPTGGKIRRPHRYSLSINATGGIGSDLSGLSVSKFDAAMAGEPSDSPVFDVSPGGYYSKPGNAANYEEIVQNVVTLEKDNSYDYLPPVQFGVYARLGLGRILYVETGVGAEILHSTAKSIGASQTLTYLGIPIGIGANIVNKDNFYLYAGTEAGWARCIDQKKSVHFPSNYTSCKEIPDLFSAGGKIGAGYNVWNHFSLYFEPSVSYHFCRGEMPRTVYNAHPLYPAVKAGIRYSLR
ncbi:MAG: hypothetical protein HUJ91_04905 [Bacteroidales bacterium]|nr:hypothetical protein [Bacteroidales bacterium]